MASEKTNPRVLYIGRYNETEILSGPEKVAKRIFTGYCRTQPGLFLEYFFDGNTYGLSAKLFGKQIVQNDSNCKVIRAGLFRILPVIFSYKPEIMHIITFERFAVIALVYRFFRGVKIVYNAHGVITHENLTIRKVSLLYRLKDRICERLIFKYSDKIIFYSASSIDIAEKYFRLDESHVVILSSGIDSVFNRIYREHVGQFQPQLRIVIMSDKEFLNKGLKILKEMRQYIKSPVEINLIGNVMSSAFGNGNGLISVRFINKLDTHRLADFYKDKDVYLSFRQYETFSIAAVEAMAAGLIPLVSKETGMSRYIINGENGYVLEEITSESIAACINNLAGNGELRKNMSLNSSNIYDLLSWEQVFETFRDVYEGLVQKHFPLREELKEAAQ